MLSLSAGTGYQTRLQQMRSRSLFDQAFELPDGLGHPGQRPRQIGDPETDIDKDRRLRVYEIGCIGIVLMNMPEFPGHADLDDLAGAGAGFQRKVEGVVSSVRALGR